MVNGSMPTVAALAWFAASGLARAPAANPNPPTYGGFDTAETYPSRLDVWGHAVSRALFPDVTR
ncbi:MAG TPA: hypothetical protein VN325_25850 [Steroidobacteraceae bacterium]|nr:hypothetical protein [Steroidobacteraceae bacterium]